MAAPKAEHQKTNLRVDFTNPVVRASALISYARANLKDYHRQDELAPAYTLIEELQKALFLE